MPNRISRRNLLKTVGGASASQLLPAARSVETRPRILPLTSTSGVFIPPRGRSFLKFSFDFPEPSVEFEGLQFSFRVYTFENTYTLIQGAMSIKAAEEGIEIKCSQLAWAGGQEKSPGNLSARVRKGGDFIECAATAEMNQPVKSLAAIVRGVPRGKISAAGQPFYDPGDDESPPGEVRRFRAVLAAAMLGMDPAIMPSDAQRRDERVLANDRLGRDVPQADAPGAVQVHLPVLVEILAFRRAMARGEVLA